MEAFYTDEHEDGELTIRVKHVFDDETPDFYLDFLGEFSDRGGEFKFNPSYEIARNVGTDRDGYCYYNPSYPVENDRKFYRKAGYSKHESYTLARANALNNMNRLIGLYDGDWFFIGIVVEVLYKDRVIGSDSLWGIESDSDSEYIQATETDLEFSATAEANNFIKALTSLK